MASSGFLESCWWVGTISMRVMPTCSTKAGLWLTIASELPPSGAFLLAIIEKRGLKSSVLHFFVLRLICRPFGNIIFWSACLDSKLASFQSFDGWFIKLQTYSIVVSLRDCCFSSSTLSLRSFKRSSSVLSIRLSFSSLLISPFTRSCNIRVFCSSNSVSALRFASSAVLALPSFSTAVRLRISLKSRIVPSVGQISWSRLSKASRYDVN